MSNVINLNKIRAYRKIEQEEFLKVFSVIVDPLTGDWLEEPTYIGQMVTESYWLSQEDTSKEKHIISKTQDTNEDIALLILYK